MSVVETFHGYIETTQDALLVLEACRRGLLPTVSRRLQEKERKLVRSGSVFVFDEKNSGIKRWTDGLVWSPSRILGNFLIYRELEKRIPKRKKPSMDMTNGRNRPHRSNSIVEQQQQQQPSLHHHSMKQQQHKERQLVGSLSDAYNFKEDGLIKKTLSLIVDGSPLHLISYYHPDDVVAHKLRTPSTVPELVNLEISPELLVKQNFRIPPMVEPDQYTQPSSSSSSSYYPTPSSTTGYSAAAGQLAKSVPSSSSSLRSLSLPSTDYMHHQPIYTRHNSISQFHHSASPFSPTTPSSSSSSSSSSITDYTSPQYHHHHRGSLQLDRANTTTTTTAAAKSLIFDPMYNITSYNNNNNTLPSPTSSSPTTPLPISMLPPTELCTNTSSPLSSSSSSSSSFDYSHQHQHHQQHHHHHHHHPHLQQKPVAEQHSRILNLPTLTRQDHTSITSLLSNEPPTHHQHHHQHHHQDDTTAHHHQQQQYYSHQHPPTDYYHGTATTSNDQKPPGAALYPLDDTTMQWI